MREGEDYKPVTPHLHNLPPSLCLYIGTLGRLSDLWATIQPSATRCLFLYLTGTQRKLSIIQICTDRLWLSGMCECGLGGVVILLNLVL